MENVADVYPLTPAQEGLLFHTLAEPGSGVYVDRVAVTLRGPLREEALQEAWRLAVERHPALRTAFLWDGLDQPLQVVRGTVGLPWTTDDWRGLGPEAVQGRLDALLDEDRAQGLALEKAPLVRLRLVRTADDEHRLLWTFHHLVLDGWSTATVLREVWADYAALVQGRARGSEAPRPFRDLVAWVQRQDLGAAEAFWRDALAGFEAPTSLGIDAGAASGPVAQRETTLPADVTARLGEAARRHRLTLNTVVQGAWAMLLGRYSGERDVVFGATVSGRPAEIQGVEAMVGMFINSLPVRAAVDPEAGLWETLRGLQDHVLAARRFEHAPLARVQSWSDVPGGQALFESLVVFENYPASGETPAAEVGLHVEDLDFQEQSNYPLALIVVPGEGLRLIAVHDTGRFEAPAIDRMLGHLGVLLQGIADAPEGARLRDLAILPEAERAHLLALASGPERSPIPEGGVLGMIEVHVRHTPNADAVVTEAGSLTYAELWAASGRLAGHLRACGVGEGAPVGLCLPRTTNLLVGMLGILRAGGAYVPLDPAHPDARLRSILDDAGAAALVTSGGRTLGAEADLAVVDLDAPLDDAESPAPPSLGALAYVLYTSGSTGRPKGVPVSHRHLAHSTLARLDHYPEAVGRFLLLSSVAFDSSVAGLFWTLVSGGALVLPAERQEQDVPALAALIARHGVTHTLTLPSLWRVILDLAAPDDLASLQRVILAGEALAPDVAAAHRARLGAALANEYGPTEATVWATAHEVTTAPARIPIGRPIPGAWATVLDGMGDLAPVGVPGELALGGDGVVEGYLGRPEATAAAFGPNSFGDGRLYRTGDRARWREDGALDFLGRADGQVKVRGHRIELGEVEAALREHPAVREAAASVHVPEAGGARLLGYVVGDAPEAADVKAFLQSRVPDYMVPSAVIVLDAMPRTRTGKLDRNALPAPEAAPASGHVAPRTEAERALAQIWADVLGLETVGVTDNFFEIGGDSIASIQIISRANRAGLGLRPAQFFERPTVEALAAVAAAPGEAGETMPAGPVPLTPIQRWFFGLGLPSPSLWTQAVTVDLKPSTDTDRLVEAVCRVAEAHDAFRLRFARTEDGWTQRLAEPGDLRLHISTHDLSSVPEEGRESAAERAWTDAQAGLDIKRGPLLRIDVLGPDPRRLILTAHHLAVDVVSWQTILSQVEDAYARLGAGKEAAVTASGTPFGRYAEALEAFASSPEVEAERDGWRAQTAEAVPPLPTDADGPNTERSAQTVRVGWSAVETQALTDATTAYGMNVPEMLLAAVAEAVGDWTGADRVRIDLEGHGRDDLGGAVEVAQTVGWFTTVYPVTLAPAPGDPRAALIGAKEAVRAVPRQGLGYGLLRHGPAPDARLGDGAEILVNYLGRGQAPFGAASPFAGTPDVWGAHGPGGERAHLLEVVARIDAGALDVRWSFSASRHQAETIERLAHATLEALARLVDHARAPEAGAYTPSDFPDVDLGQDALDALLDDFD